MHRSRTVRFRQFLHDKQVHKAGNSTPCFASLALRENVNFIAEDFC
jgi:hypothetical protein